MRRSRYSSAFLASLGLFWALGVGWAGEDDLCRLEKIEIGKAKEEVLVHIRGTKAPDFTTFTLKDPFRLVLDWAGSRVAGAPARQSFDGLVRKITAKQHDSESDRISRVTIELAKETEYKLETKGSAVLVRFKKVALPEPEPKPKKKAPEPESKKGAKPIALPEGPAASGPAKEKVAPAGEGPKVSLVAGEKTKAKPTKTTAPDKSEMARREREAFVKKAIAEEATRKAEVEKKRQEAARAKALEEQRKREEAARAKALEEEQKRQEAARQKALERERKREEAARAKALAEERKREEAARAKAEAEKKRQEAARAKALEEERRREEAARAKALEEEQKREKAARAKALEQERKREKAARAKALEEERKREETARAQTLKEEQARRDAEEREALAEQQRREEADQQRRAAEAFAKAEADRKRLEAERAAQARAREEEQQRQKAESERAAKKARPRVPGLPVVRLQAPEEEDDGVTPFPIIGKGRAATVRKKKPAREQAWDYDEEEPAWEEQPRAQKTAAPAGFGQDVPDVIESKDGSDPGTRRMTYIGFSQQPKKSAVFVKLDGKAKYKLVKEEGTKVVLTLVDTVVELENNTRHLDTRFFDSPVVNIQAHPVSADVRVEIDLRNMVGYSVKRIGRQIWVYFNR